MKKLAFYCVTDSTHFLGLVALVNSLRVLGHGETVYVLDCGLEPWQRALLAQGREIAVVDAGSSRHPTLLKAVLPLATPAETMIVVDVDIIFTGRLDTLVDAAARSGKPVFFPDCSADRFYPEWERLGFGPPVPHPFVAAGQFVLRAESGREFLTLWAEGLQRLVSDPTLLSSGLSKEADPFHFLDMDVLNAMIGPAIPLDSFILADAATVAYPPFEGVRIVDPERLVVDSSDGSRPILLHHFLNKPWNALVAPNPYSRLMTRLLYADDVPLRPASRHIPYSLRPGIGGSIARRYVVARLWARRRNLRGRLGIKPVLAKHLRGIRSPVRDG